MVTLVPEPVAFGGPPPPSGPIRQWFFADHLGTPVVITNATTFLRRRVFEPFGMLIAETDLGGYRPQTVFTGKGLDADVGMYDFAARWYDAATASFASVDPLVSDLANASSHNGYSYVQNQPMRLVDPDGMQAAVGGASFGGLSLSTSFNFGPAASYTGYGSVYVSPRELANSVNSGVAPASAAGQALQRGGSLVETTSGFTVAQTPGSSFGGEDAGFTYSAVAPSINPFFVIGTVASVGGIASSIGEYSNEIPGYWRAPLRLKDGSRPYLANHPHSWGNGALGRRKLAQARAGVYRGVGKLFFAASVAISLAEGAAGTKPAHQVAGDVVMAFVGMAGPPGAMAAAVYFVATTAISAGIVDSAGAAAGGPQGGGY